MEKGKWSKIFLKKGHNLTGEIQYNSIRDSIIFMIVKWCFKEIHWENTHGLGLESQQECIKGAGEMTQQLELSSVSSTHMVGSSWPSATPVPGICYDALSRLVDSTSLAPGSKDSVSKKIVESNRYSTTLGILLWPAQAHLYLNIYTPSYINTWQNPT